MKNPFKKNKTYYIKKIEYRNGDILFQPFCYISDNDQYIAVKVSTEDKYILKSIVYNGKCFKSYNEALEALNEAIQYYNSKKIKNEEIFEVE